MFGPVPADWGFPVVSALWDDANAAVGAALRPLNVFVVFCRTANKLALNNFLRPLAGPGLLPLSIFASVVAGVEGLEAVGAGVGAGCTKVNGTTVGCPGAGAGLSVMQAPYIQRSSSSLAM